MKMKLYIFVVFLTFPYFLQAQALRTPGGKIFSTSNGKVIVAKLQGVLVLTSSVRSASTTGLGVRGVSAYYWSRNQVVSAQFSGANCVVLEPTNFMFNFIFSVAKRNGGLLCCIKE